MQIFIRRIILFPIFSLILFSLQAQNNSLIIEKTSATRQQICLNGLWKFIPAADNSDTSSSGDWGSIWVPGAWHQDAWWASCPGIQEKGKSDLWKTPPSMIYKAWYEHSFSITSDWKNKTILVDFSRISTDAIVYVNNQKVGSIHWPGGIVDIISQVKIGKVQTLRLLVLA